MTKRLIISLLLFSLLPSMLGAEKMEQQGNIGFLVDGIHDVRYKDARLAFTMWMNDLASTDDITVKINFIDSYEKIMKDYEAGHFNGLTVNPIFYLQFQRMIDRQSKAYWIVRKTKNRFSKMVLLANDKSGIDSLADMKAKHVAIRDDNYMGELFLDAEMLKNVHVGTQGYIDGIINTKRHSTAILKTFFGKVDACIVPEYAMRLVYEMNPAVGKKLKVLLLSEEIFLPIIFTFYKDADDSMIRAFKHSSASLENNPRGRNILDLFKMTGVEQVSVETLQPLKAYYSEYLALKQRYGKNYD